MYLRLNKGFESIIDDEDYDRIKGIKWSVNNERGFHYVIGYHKSNLIRLHRLIIKAKPGEFVDHKNHNTLDNRKCNLRIATPQQNSFNRYSQKATSTKYKGVSLRKATGKYEAYISINKKRKHLGFFDKPELAALAYDEAAKKHHGDFVNLNFPSIEVINHIKPTYYLSTSRSHNGIILTDINTGFSKIFSSMDEIKNFLGDKS